MTEEEKKAIMQLLWYKQLFDKGYCEDCNELCSSGASIPSKDLSKQIEIVLNLTKKQQEELDKKDKEYKELEESSKVLSRTVNFMKKEIKEYKELIQQKDKSYNHLKKSLKGIINKQNKIIVEMASEISCQLTIFNKEIQEYVKKEAEKGEYTNLDEIIKKYFYKKVESEDNI